MKSRRWFVILGIVILIVSTLVASMSGTGGRGDAPIKSGDSSPVQLVCYGHVDVEGGVIPLYPLQPGRVVDVLVAENDDVQKGAILLEVDDQPARYRWRQAHADLASAQAQARQAKTAQQRHRAKIAQQQAAIDALAHDLEAAKLGLQRKEMLAKDRLASPIEVAIAKQVVKKIEAGIRAEKEKLRELSLFDVDSEVERTKANVAAKQAQLEEAEFALEQCRLRAPVDGQVLQILVSPGSVLPPNPTRTALVFCPAKPLIVRAEVEQEFAHLLKEGRAVTVESEFAAHRPWRGKIARVANWYTHSRFDANRILRVQDEPRTLECIVTLEEGEPGFRIGEQVRVIVRPE
ncbi:MAG: hypothetical protein KatS3mg105_1950 [Gemmatales bacterium]|nr:MAG: hypothetical protein KatS3mg105_1950 [Gemmatales bacterium]